MSTRKLIGKVSATEKNPSSCDEFQFWMSDDTILSPFDIVLVQNKTDVCLFSFQIYKNHSWLNDLYSKSSDSSD